MTDNTGRIIDQYSSKFSWIGLFTGPIEDFDKPVAELSQPFTTAIICTD